MMWTQNGAVIIFLIMIQQVSCFNSGNSKFLVVYPKVTTDLPVGQWLTVGLVWQSNSAVVTISQSSTQRYSFKLENPNTFVIQSLGYHLMMDSTDIFTEKGIFIETSSGSIVVNAFQEVKIFDKWHITSFYTAIPLHLLGNSYTVMTQCSESSDCVLAVASHYDDTQVEVKVPLAGGFDPDKIQVNGIRTADGKFWIVSITLHASESFQMLANGQNMTGATVTSDQEVVVISGRGMAAIHDGATSFSDSSAQQLPPTDHLGLVYVIRGLQPFSPYWVHVTKVHPNTAITHHPVTDVRVEKDSDLEQVLYVETRGTFVLQGDGPLLVSVKYKYPLKEDAGCMLVAPKSQWERKYTIVLPETPTTFYVIIAIRKSCSTLFEVNDYRQVELENVHEYSTMNYTTGFLNLNPPNWMRRIFIKSYEDYQDNRPKCPFGAIAISNNRTTNAWGYPFGWHRMPRVTGVATSNQPLTTATTTPSTAITTPTTAITTPTTAITTPSTTTTATTTPTTAITTPSTTTATTTPIAITTPSTTTTATTTPTAITTPSTTTTAISTPTSTPTTSVQPYANGSYAETVSSHKLCRCPCSLQAVQVGNMTSQEQKLVLKSIAKHLQVNVSKLSRTVRKKESTTDFRMSSSSIGASFAIVVVGSVFVLVVIPDVLQMLYCGIKRAKCGLRENKRES